jgi:purine-nucleoside phosphorylase
MLDLAEKIDDAAHAVRARWDATPEAGIILGTGLGGLSQQMEVAETIPYRDLPHFPESTVAGHAGQLLCGRLNRKNVVVLEGRFHYYEGYSMKQITFPVRVLRALGAGLLVVSNVAGAMNPQYDLADLVVIEDHINLMGDNPLIGVNDDRLGPRFPDMSRPYDPDLIALAKRLSLEMGIPTHKGVYAAVAGPNLETRAEYRMLRAAGADVVGMSTVPEVLVACHAGMRVLGFSVVSDLCLPDALEPVELDAIIATAARGGAKLQALIGRVLQEIP